MTIRLPLRSAAAFAALAVLLTSAPAAHAGLAIGDTAPLAAVKMRNVDGTDVTIAGIAGKKGTLVVFTCNHCPWAKMWEQRVTEIGGAALAAGLGAIAINSNDPEVFPEDGYADTQKRAKALGMKFPYVVDATSEVARAFGATRTPEAFVFDARGKLVYHGAVDDNARDAAGVQEAWLRDAVNAVAAGKTVTTAETKAVGCSIKYRSEKKTAS